MMYYPSAQDMHESIRRTISAMLVSDEEIIAIAKSDICHDVSYGNEYLLLTNKRLFVLSLEGKVLEETWLKDVNMATLKAHLGLCVLVLDTRLGVKNVLFFSPSKKRIFEKLVALINDLTLNAIPASEIKANLGKELRLREREGKRAILIRLLKFMKPFWPLVATAFTISIIARILGLLPPYLMAILIDKVLVPRSNFNLLIEIIAALLGINVISLILRTILNYVNLKLNLKLTYRFRLKLYEKLQFLSLRFYDRYSTGSIISRVSSDVERIKNFLTQGLQSMVMDLIAMASIGVILVTMSPWLTLLALLPIPVSLIGSTLYRRSASKYYHRLWKRWSDMISILSESLSAFILVRSLGREHRMITEFAHRLDRYNTANIEVFKYEQKFWPAIGLSFTLSSLLVWWFGGLQVLRDQLTLGALTAFTSYMWSFYGPINDLLSQVRSIPMVTTSSERIFEILDEDLEVTESPKAKEVQMKGAIEFKDVWFTYDGVHYALRGVSLRIKPGEHIGIVGPSGSGKSTLVKLLLRFYEPQRGRVLIDGVDIRDVKLEALKRQIAIVMQNPVLFDVSIAENIALGKENATLEEIIAAAKAANAHEFIMKLPEAYDTKVGVRGRRLSGGERQRVAIAMALLKDPRILILDEPTSSLDAIAEREVSKAIENLTRGRTTIIIAHRLSTLRNVDRIIVLERGIIVEEGTHAELLRRNGLYKRLFDAQFEGFTRPIPMPIRRRKP